MKHFFARQLVRERLDDELSAHVIEVYRDYVVHFHHLIHGLTNNRGIKDWHVTPNPTGIRINPTHGWAEPWLKAEYLTSDVNTRNDLMAADAEALREQQASLAITTQMQRRAQLLAELKEIDDGLS